MSYTLVLFRSINIKSLWESLFPLLCTHSFTIIKDKTYQICYRLIAMWLKTHEHQKKTSWYFFRLWITSNSNKHRYLRTLINSHVLHLQWWRSRKIKEKLGVPMSVYLAWVFTLLENKKHMQHVDAYSQKRNI